jgi:hypothetical protein
LENDAEIDRTPPISLFLSGESFLHAARHLHAGVDAKELRLRFEMPIYYLYSHAVELALKSYLRTCGVSVKDLGRKFGHDLNRLLQGCVERGLVLKPVPEAFVPEMVGMLADLGRNHEFRYVTIGLKRYPELVDVSTACDMLFDAIRPTVRATEPGPIPDRPQ